MPNKPPTSIIIPCRNEEAYIETCLQSVINNDYPNELTEILVVDGMSTDTTREIVARLAQRHPNIKLIDNPHKTAPQAFNIGINASTGDYVLIIGAHSEYPGNFVSKLIEWHGKLDADNIGGVMITDVRNKNKKTEAIIAVLSNKLGVGDASFRVGSNEVKSVDTVAYGCYRRECFDKFGLFNEQLIRNQDIEFNKRIINGGGKIYLVPEIQCRYFARETYRGLAKNNYLNGLWNILTVYHTRSMGSLSPRHFIPMLFMLSLVVPALLSCLFHPLIWLSVLSLTAYLALVAGVSLSLNNKETGFLKLVWTFIVLHFSYGMGSLAGFFKIPFKLLNLDK